MRLARNFGFRGYDTVLSLGTNAKMNEICAAMGLAGLDSLAHFVDVNRAHYHAYLERLKDVPGIIPALIRILHDENILARRYFHPGCHRMPPYATEQPDAAAQLPNTEALSTRVLSLPTGTGVQRADIDAITGLIGFAFSHAADIRAALAAKDA